jgi:hypothetical protein
MLLHGDNKGFGNRKGVKGTSNLRPVRKTFKPIVGQSFGAVDVHRGIEKFVRATLGGLPENIDADVIITLPDRRKVNTVCIIYQEPDDILILGFDKNSDEIRMSIPYGSINLSIILRPLNDGEEKNEIQFRLEDGETELSSSQ